MRLSFPLALLVVLLSACGGAHLTSRDARWLRAETPHFTLHTDLSQHRALAEAENLEKLLEAYLQHSWQHTGKPSFHLQVVMFRDPGEFARFARPPVAGYYMSDVLREPWIVLKAPSERSKLEVVSHELTHHLAYQGIQAQPAWFAEGLATYFETASFLKDGSFAVGEIPKIASALYNFGLLPVERLFAGDKEGALMRFYGTAWLLVHYLMDERESAFIRYQALLREGTSHDAAWQHALPDLPVERLDGVLQAYFAKLDFKVFARPFKASPVAVRTRPLSVADRYALQAVLQSSCPACGPVELKKAEQDAQRALQEDPRQLEASVLWAQRPELDPKLAIARMRALTRSHPDAWLPWASLGILLAKAGQLAVPGGGPDPVERAHALAPQHPYTWLLIALQRAERNERAVALEALKRARYLAPTNPTILHSSAELYARLSACPSLAEVARTMEAVDSLHGGHPGLAHVKELAASCRAAPASASQPRDESAGPSGARPADARSAVTR